MQRYVNFDAQSVGKIQEVLSQLVGQKKVGEQRENMKILSALICGSLVAMLALPVAAQKKRPEFAEMHNARHLKENPLVGESLEEVDVFDSNGKKFSTSQFEGKHTVLVFGCLT